MRFVFRILSFVLVLTVMFFSASCSEKKCIDVIPSGSTALMSIDVPRMKSENMDLIKNLFNTSDIENCGLDLDEKMYIFETADGNFGFCADVADDGQLADFFKTLSAKGICTPVQERSNIKFILIDNSWVAGFTDDVIMICGPVTASVASEMQVRMASYMRQEKDEGIEKTPMYDCLDSLDSPVAIVAKGTALPENFVAPFIMGVPKDVELSDVVIAASLEADNDCIFINGNTISFDKEKDSKIRNSSKVFRPVTDRYIKAMSKDDFAGFFLNVDGDEFLPLLQNNKSMQALLASVNTVVDMNNIIKSVNGDLAVVCPEYSDKTMRFFMSAQLDDTSWLADVDYWKKSCPAGGKIADWKENSYYYTDGGKNAYYFGVTGDKQYFSGTDSELALSSVGTSSHPLDSRLISKLKGNRVVLIVNTPEDNANGKSSEVSVLKHLLGSIRTIVYCVR